MVALLGETPFAGVPPRYVRAVLWEYRFTDTATRARDKTWWQRETRGLYAPVVGPRSGGGG